MDNIRDMGKDRRQEGNRLNEELDNSSFFDEDKRY
jgi:hypothetical protein